MERFIIVIMAKKYCWLLLLLFLSGCAGDYDKEYFNGEIHIVKDIPVTDVLKGEKLELDGVYTGFFYVVDSLMFFTNFMDPEYNISVFNNNTGKYIGSFIRKGRGPNESIDALSPYNFWFKITKTGDF